MVVPTQFTLYSRFVGMSIGHPQFLDKVGFNVYSNKGAQCAPLTFNVRFFQYAP